jgi:hypothetical protein
MAFQIQRVFRIFFQNLAVISEIRQGYMGGGADLECHSDASLALRSVATKESTTGLIYGQENGHVDSWSFFPALFIYFKKSCYHSVSKLTIRNVNKNPK